MDSATEASQGMPAGTARDYGWETTTRTAAHSYIEPTALALVQSLARSARPDGRPLRVFDAGCGNGSLLRQLHAQGYEVAGCDASATGVALARQGAGPGVRIEQLSLYEDLAARMGSDWDVVISTEVIEHLYEPRTFVARARQMLRPGGHLVLSTPYHGYLKNVVLATTGKLDGHFTALWDGGHIKFWSRATLTALLSEQGFGDFRFQGAGRLPYLWKSMFLLGRTPTG